MLLEIQNAAKAYRTSGDTTVRALDGVSIGVDTGDFVAVQGPSGCGKTTLLLIAGGVLVPDQGHVQIAGQDPYALSAEARARFRGTTIGFVFQQFYLVPYLSVFDNVLVPAMACERPDATERAGELIARFGLTDRSHHVPARLSTGERQRVALARALFNEPKLLLADEPTGNLDRENADLVLGALTDFANEGGAVLLVTHDDHAATYAKHIVRLEYGRVATPAETSTTGDSQAV